MSSDAIAIIVDSSHTIIPLRDLLPKTFVNWSFSNQSTQRNAHLKISITLHVSVRSWWLLIRNEALNAFFNSSRTSISLWGLSFKALSVEILQISEKTEKRVPKTSITSQVRVRSWWFFISNDALHVPYNTSHTIVSIWCLLPNAFLSWSPFKHWKSENSESGKILGNGQ